MAKRRHGQTPEGSQAGAPEAAEEQQEEQAAEAPVQNPYLRRRPPGVDKFQDPSEKKAPAFVLNAQRNDPSVRLPRSRVLDPRLVPLVPPGVTTDPSRQFHALLGLRPSGSLLPDAARRREHPPMPPPPKPKEVPPAIDKVLKSLPNARAQIIRQVLTGPESRLQRALNAFIEDQRFQKLDFESQRRALAAFDLRY